LSLTSRDTCVDERYYKQLITIKERMEKKARMV